MRPKNVLYTSLEHQGKFLYICSFLENFSLSGWLVPSWVVVILSLIYLGLMILFYDILKSEKHRLWSNPRGLGFLLKSQIFRQMTEPGVELKSRPPEWRCSDWITWTLGDYYGCFTYFKIGEEKLHAYPLRQSCYRIQKQGNVKANAGKCQM